MFPDGEIKGKEPEFSRLGRRAYHDTHCKCICGNELCFVQSTNAVCDECGARYVTMGIRNGCGCPLVYNGDNNSITVNETFLLDPHTVNDDVLKRFGQIEYEHTFTWEM